jgi:ribonuclease R
MPNNKDDYNERKDSNRAKPKGNFSKPSGGFGKPKGSFGEKRDSGGYQGKRDDNRSSFGGDNRNSGGYQGKRDDNRSSFGGGDNRNSGVYQGKREDNRSSFGGDNRNSGGYQGKRDDSRSSFGVGDNRNFGGYQGKRDDNRGFSSDRGFSESRNDDSRDFGDKKSFGDKPRGRFGKPSFGDKRNSGSFRDKDDNRSFGAKKDFGFKDKRDNKGFSDKKPYSGGQKSSKPAEKNEPKISLEYVLNYFHKHDVVDINDVQSLLVGNNSDIFFSKVNLLMNNNIVEIAGDNKLKLNSTYINDSLCEYSYIKIKSQLVGKHYLVDMSPLDKKLQSEEEVIIEELKENLKDRLILCKISIDGEKIIANPIFYLNDISEQDIKQLENSGLIKGIYQKYDNIDVIVPVSIKSRRNINLSEIPANLQIGTMIEARFTSKPDDFAPQAIFSKIISADNSATSSSMLSVYQYDLHYKFSEEILETAKNFTGVELGTRRDIRHIPLVTIDDDDAKDFDDAIFAKEIEGRPDTYQIYVAIADVAHYVKPNDALDVEAKLRGNSVYLPGFVIPMLPKELSNGWCSLNPNEERGCLVMEGIINRNGELENFDFYRGLMKSHARLTYSEVATAIDGEVSEKLQPLMETVINPLHSAFLLLDMARKKRNAVEISSKESKFILDKHENILDVIAKESLVSHKIVEEFMISANVATAKLIARNGLAQSGKAIYRIHAKPSVEKVMNFTGALKSFGLDIRSPENVTSNFFNNLLKEFAEKNIFNSLNEAVLRCQSQAEYSNENIGHFGLALKEYCHFTSPIRRYSDLMIHRLILSIVDGEEFNYSAAEVSNIAQSISLSERLAFNAEKSAKNRVFAKWLSSKIGESFLSEVSTITNAGMFVNLIDNGASGLVPMRTISRGFASVDLNRHIIKDKEANRSFTLGDKVPVIIKEADEIRGMLTFLLDDDKMQSESKKRFK